MIPGLQISAVCDNIGGNNSNSNFRLRWNTYESNLTHVFEQLLLAGDFVDVSLVCPGTENAKSRTLKAHRVILSACSPFFQRLLLEHPATECSLHPTVVIMPEEVSADDLAHVLQFVYSGELDIPRDRVEAVLRAAANLEIKGLSLDCLEEQMSRESSLSSTSYAAPLPPPRPSSQQSLDGHTSSSRKRKSSPKFRFTKQKRKSHKPTKRSCDDAKTLEEAEMEAEMRQDDAECDAEVERANNANDMPVDFTINKKRHDEEEEEEPSAEVVVPRRGRGRPPRLSPGQLAFLSRRQVEIFARDADGGPPTMIVGPADTTTTSELQQQQQQQIEVDNDNDDDDSLSKANYSKGDMSQALDALKMKKLTLTKASELYGIPPTTLWQRANRYLIRHLS